MGEVQQRPRDELRCAVGMHVAQLGAEVGNRSRARQPERDTGMAEDLDLVLERLPVVDQAERLVRALVLWLPPRQRSGAADPRGPPDVPADLELVGSLTVAVRAGLRQLERQRRRAVERPSWFVAPLAPIDAKHGGRRRGTACEQQDRWLAVDTVV